MNRRNFFGALVAIATAPKAVKLVSPAAVAVWRDLGTNGWHFVAGEVIAYQGTQPPQFIDDARAYMARRWTVTAVDYRGGTVTIG